LHFGLLSTKFINIALERLIHGASSWKNLHHRRRAQTLVIANVVARDRFKATALKTPIAFTVDAGAKPDCDPGRP
jgi:hypothetical protein